MRPRFHVFRVQHDDRLLAFYHSELSALEDLWNVREMIDSPAAQWLTTLNFKPDTTPIMRWLSGVRARSIVNGIKDAAERDGVVVLSTRERQTYNGGPKNPRAIVTDDGTRYPSIGMAAESLGVSKSTICRRLKRGKYKITN